jgi:hypothetical protein
VFSFSEDQRIPAEAGMCQALTTPVDNNQTSKTYHTDHDACNGTKDKPDHS